MKARRAYLARSDRLYADYRARFWRLKRRLARTSGGRKVRGFGGVVDRCPDRGASRGGHRRALNADHGAMVALCRGSRGPAPSTW